MAPMIRGCTLPSERISPFPSGVYTTYDTYEYLRRGASEAVGRWSF